MKMTFRVITLAALVAALGGAYWLGKSQNPPMPSTASNSPPAAPAKNTPPPVTVEATRVVEAKIAQSITAVGTLRSDESVIVRPEISGRVAEILFHEGERVAKGATLIRLDDAVQRAEWKQAEANLSLAKTKLERALDLQKKGFVSGQARDEAENNFRVAQAASDLAAAKLTKLEIKAPFSGLVGLRLVSVGDYVKDGQDLVNLEGVDPLKVDFKVPEIFLKEVSVGQNLEIGLDAFPGKMFSGKVYAINPLIDANGRSIVIRALTRNAEARLRPGMFARVRLLLNASQNALLVPEQAIIPVGNDHFLFRVVEGRAQRTKVEIGQRREGQVEIVQGLSNQDVIIVAGQLKVRDGAAVNVASATESPTLPGSAGATQSPVKDKS